MGVSFPEIHEWDAAINEMHYVNLRFTYLLTMLVLV